LASVVFTAGDGIVEPFLLRDSDGAIVNLDGKIVTGSVWARRIKKFDLVVGAGIFVELLNPPSNPSDQSPHGYYLRTSN
jgi:hypothetical protein